MTDETASSARIHYGCLIPSVADYFTQLMIFPGSNARKPWGLHGAFTLGGTVFTKGNPETVIATRSCTEEEHLKLDFETPLKALGKDASGFGVLALDSAGGIPVEIYLSHIHRKTGVYFAYPALMFMGDLLYPHAHIERLENSMFWPGFPAWEDTEFKLVMMNPFDLPMAAEITLWNNREGKHHVGVRRVSPRECLWVSMDEIMPAAWQVQNDPACSLGVTAQFKLLAYMVMINRRTGIITSADHLHPYQLF